MQYTTRKLDKNAVSRKFKFANIIEQKGNIYQWNDKFFDPRPQHAKEQLFAKEVFIEEGFFVRAVNLYNKDGEFCCSYINHNVGYILEANKLDCELRDLEINSQHKSKNEESLNELSDKNLTKNEKPYRPTMEESERSIERLNQQKDDYGYDYNNYIDH